jgi:SnoaL-like polyketide cyclase
LQKAEKQESAKRKCVQTTPYATLCISAPIGDDRRETEETMSEQNKKLARRWFEDLFSLGDLDAANEILSAEFVDHLPREEERGIEELKNYVGIYRTAFPDIQDTVEDIVAEGDKVVVR